MEENQSIKEILDSAGMYTGLTTGTSMQPLIHNQKDNIIIKKVDGRLKKYDVALYVTDRGKNILHRVIKVCDDHYVIIGDNRLEKEYVSFDKVCGKLVGFYKNGKTYVDCENSVKYKMYSRVWVALYPFRPLYQLAIRIWVWFKRHILKRGDC